MTALTDDQLRELRGDMSYASINGTIIDELLATRARLRELEAQHKEDKRLWTADMRALREAKP